MRILVLTLSLFSLIFVSCQKELSGEEGTTVPVDSTAGGTLYRIQQGTNPDLTDDTIFLISYDPSGKMVQIVDSLYSDTLRITYNTNNKIQLASWTSGLSTTYLYNSDQKLQSVSYTFAGQKDQYTYEYTGGVLSKSVYSTDAGSGGALFIWRSYVYVVVDGNITRMKTYLPDGSFESEQVLTYGTEPNPFKDLALLNVGNSLGFYPFIEPDMSFNTNICTGSVTGGNTPVSTKYTFNSKQQPVKAVATNNTATYKYTWQFSYKKQLPATHMYWHYYRKIIRGPYFSSRKNAVFQAAFFYYL